MRKFTGRPEDGAAHTCTHPPYTAAKLCGKLSQSACPTLLFCQRNHAMPHSGQGGIEAGGAVKNLQSKVFFIVLSFLSKVQESQLASSWMSTCLPPNLPTCLPPNLPIELAYLPTCLTPKAHRLPFVYQTNTHKAWREHIQSLERTHSSVRENTF